jgi:cytoskeletal protein CcmA (bactofilin family)
MLIHAQKVQFRDAAIYLNSSVDGQLDIVADGEVQIDTALVDINGNLDVSGTTNISGSVSFTKNAIAGVAISTTSRSSNTVTVTTSAVHGLTSGDLVNVNGVADTSFNGYFTASVSSTTVFTYSQTGADGSSTGGTSTEVVYNLNASGTALNWMNGPLNIAANSGIDGLEITQSGAGNGLHVTGTTGLVGNVDVTGTVTADGLTVDGNVDAASFTSTGSTYVDINNGTVTGRLQTISSDFFIGTATVGTSLAFKSGNGVEAIRVDSSQNVGIGTSSPAAPLDVVSSSGAVGAYIRGRSSDNIGSLYFTSNADASTEYGFIQGRSTDLRIQGFNNGLILQPTSGNVGIGTSSPATQLHVADGSDSNAQIRINGSTSTVYSRLYSDNNGVLAISTDGGNQVAGSYMMFEVKGTERMRIDASGNVGIGTSSPSTKLHVKSTTDNIVATQVSTNTVNALFQSIESAALAQIGTPGAHDFTLFTDNTERMRIDASGNVGIGASTSLDNKLEVNGGSVRVRGTSTPSVKFNNGDLETVAIKLNSGATGTLGLRDDKVLIDASGNVGIGTSSPIAYGTGITTLSFKGKDASYPNRSGAIVFDSQSGSGGGASILQDAGVLYFSTGSGAALAATERMRITNTGYTKMSPTGTYVSAASSYHEMYQNYAGITSYIYNGSATGDGLLINTMNENTSNFFLAGYSDSALRYNIYLVEETADKEFYDEVVLDSDGNPVVDEDGNNVTEQKERLTGESTKSVKYSILTKIAKKPGESTTWQHLTGSFRPLSTTYNQPIWMGQSLSPIGAAMQNKPKALAMTL